MQKFKNFLRRTFQWRIFYLAKILFRLFGKSWNAFYRQLLNYQERRTTLDQILQRPQEQGVVGNPRGLYAWSGGAYHLQFMKDHGLQKDMTVFDFGCGYGRTAIPVIHYLDAEKYIGVDLSDRRIGMANEWVARENLLDKKPNFLANIDNSLPYLEDNSIDVVWTWSVFTHMPLDDIRQTLKSMRRVLKTDGIIYFHYVAFLDGEEGYREPSATFKDFYWSNQEISQVVQEAGFKATRVDDWLDNIDEKIQKDSVMLVLSKGAE